ncbi:MAG: shikimate dehydrogenase [Acidaminococcaceae bacterium]
MEFALLGEKLGHSLSPQIHNLIFRKLGIEGKYDLLEIKKQDLDDAIERLEDKYIGVNVTIPYKIAVMKKLTFISPEAKAIGAVNTIYFSKGERRGYNTDYFGFGRLLEHNAVTPLENKDVVVLGSGGAARAVLQYLVDSGTKSITVATRSPQDATKKFSNFEALPKLKFVSYEQLIEQEGGALIVNTTPVGMYPYIDVSPLPQEVVARYASAVDLIYNPVETLFMSYAKAAGRSTCNGFYMLVAQAVAAEEIWLGREIQAGLIASIAQEIQGV